MYIDIKYTNIHTILLNNFKLRLPSSTTNAESLSKFINKNKKRKENNNQKFAADISQLF